MRTNMKRLCDIINYQFKNEAYLIQALTHRSAGFENFERMEFLGDSVLSFTIAEELFRAFPSHTEGQLSRLRAFLVKGDMLAEIAKEINLGDFLLLGPGELKSGGFRRVSILADALEALFAAVYLDGGISCVQEIILKLYRTRLEQPNLYERIIDAKTQLQEYLQAQKHALPQYQLTQIEGNEHDQQFYISCIVPGLTQKTFGIGSTRRKAEQQAAQSMLNIVSTKTKN